MKWVKWFFTGIIDFDKEEIETKSTKDLIKILDEVPVTPGCGNRIVLEIIKRLNAKIGE